MYTESNISNITFNIVLIYRYNGISNLKALQLSRIPNIKGLFLQGRLNTIFIFCVHTISDCNDSSIEIAWPIFLLLQGNEISKVEGIQGLQELRELVLDQNKIKVSICHGLYVTKLNFIYAR
jgi:Leucine-rich repeat (LRR) protein